MTVLKLCVEPGCFRLTAMSRCAPCRSSRDRVRNRTSYYQTPQWRSIAHACVERDGCCLVCWSTLRLTANHIIGRADRGPDSVENTMTLCGDCHSTFEADARYGRQTDLRRRVDAIRHTLILERGLRPQGEPHDRHQHDDR